METNILDKNTNDKNTNDKKIALLLSGNLRHFYNEKYNIYKKYSELLCDYDIDVFIYTDNNDFYYKGIQYFSSKNENFELITGNPVKHIKRISRQYKKIDYDKSKEIINKILNNVFGTNLKSIHIDEYDPNIFDKIFIKENKYHNVLLNFKSSQNRKIALLSQFYKLYKCYNLMKEYEFKNKINYNIVIRSRFDGWLNLNNTNIFNLDLEKKIYCQRSDKYDVINDWWAIGDSISMCIYCQYYLNISPNLHDEICCSNRILKGEEWILDSSEIGLTYLLDSNKIKTDSKHSIKIHIHKSY